LLAQNNLFGKNNCSGAEFNVTANTDGFFEFIEIIHVARSGTETSWTIAVRIIDFAAARTFECVRTIIANNFTNEAERRFIVIDIVAVTCCCISVKLRSYDIRVPSIIENGTTITLSKV